MAVLMSLRGRRSTLWGTQPPRQKYISFEAPFPGSESRQAERGGQPLFLPVIRQGVDSVSGEQFAL